MNRPVKGVLHVELDDGTGRDGDARHEYARDGHPHDRNDDGDAGSHELAHGPALHPQDGKVQRRNEDRLFLRRQDGLQHGAEPLQDARGRDVQLLHDDERHDGVHLQHDHGHVQMRHDQGRLLHHLHLRRPEVLRDDPGVLRLHGVHAQGRLHLLRHDEQHPGLLRLLTAHPAVRGTTAQNQRPGSIHSRALIV